MVEHPQPAIAVSTVVFGLREHDGGLAVQLPLVRRIREPYLGRWALPGGPLRSDESLREAARRNLRDTTGLDARHLEQLYTFGAVERSPVDRVVSIVYWALVRSDEDTGADDDGNVEWFVADEVPQLAVDHNDIVEYALTRLRAKITYSPIAHRFCPPEFTLAELRGVFEAVLGRPFDPANFRRQMLASGALEATGRHVTGTSHRPPALYRIDPNRKRPTTLSYEENR